ncbi:MAG: flagellin lysine-N-methylase [Clostridia bacterium]|nr:flagellin lysine-N-methylase [Clostridia bacterium]
MKTYTPNYYKKFQCIADKCKHSCCIGWEIDIDEETLELYEAMEGRPGKKLRDSISFDGTPHFKLAEGGRCANLRSDGLCQIICDHTESALCDICADHPRFRNFFEDFTEVGLGLCCEEAARIIINEDTPFSITTDIKKAYEDERYCLKLRNEVFEILQDRTKTIGERFKYLAEKFDFNFEFDLQEIVPLFLSLERLDDAWTEHLEGIKEFDGKMFEDDNYSKEFENLACYFIFRHFSDGIYKEDYKGRVKYCLVSCFVIGAMVQSGQDVEEIARMYSAEIEYSEENMEKLLEEL